MQTPATSRETMKFVWKKIVVIVKLVIQFTKAERAEADPIRKRG